MLIKNYGLYWRRNVIAEYSGNKAEYTGSWARQGELLGIGVRKRRQKEVDFATQRGIYALYDDNFRLIYVGQVGRGERRLYRRLRSHTLNNLADRWTRFSWFGLLEVSKEPNKHGRFELVESTEDVQADYVTVMNQMEAILIMAAEPIRNAKNGDFGPGVTHYRQTRRGERVDELLDDEIE